MQDIIDKKIRVAITHGDINGVSYEMLLRTFEDAEILELFTPIIYGSEKVWSFYSNLFGMKIACNMIRNAEDARDGELNIVSLPHSEQRVDMGKASAEADELASRAVGAAMQDYQKGLFDVLVMAPANNEDLSAIAESLRQAGENAPKQNGSELPIAILSNNNVNFASVAGKVAADEAVKFLSVDDVVERTTTMRNAIRRDMRQDNPRVAVMALNEDIDTSDTSVEMTIIAPAITTLVGSGVQAFGPYTMKDLLEQFAYMHFDGILTMYDAQGEKISKALFDDNGYVLYSGMPLVVTSSLTSPSYEICGKGVADATSLRNAIFAAIDVYRSRFYYDEPLKNPLEKIYHERREDGEKVRFSVKKKEFDNKSDKTAAQ